MLTKKQFLERLNFIKEYEIRMGNFDKALNEFAKSDFTGFFDETTFDFLCDSLKEDMGDEYDIISAWMFDMEWGTRLTEIYDKDTGEIIADLNSPEALYDYLFTEYAKAPSKEEVKSTIKAQDNGVKFALLILDEMQNTNENVHNFGWEERNALLKYAKDKITHEYQFQRGIGADLNLDSSCYIISVLEDEG